MCLKGASRLVDLQRHVPAVPGESTEWMGNIARSRGVPGAAGSTALAAEAAGKIWLFS
jgi:hypothetical protein